MGFLSFITLSDQFTSRLDRDPEAIARSLAVQIEPKRLLHQYGHFTGGYQGSVASEGFKISCLGKSKADIRLPVYAEGTFRPSSGGTDASVVVSHAFYWRALNLLLFAIALPCIFGGPVLSLVGDFPPSQNRWAVLGGSMVFPVLWLCVNLYTWLAVRRVRRDVEELLRVNGRSVVAL